MYTTLFLIKEFKKKWLYLLFTMPLMIGFSVVLTGEHFLIDVIAGYLFAILVIIFLNELKRLFFPDNSNHLICKK